MCVWYVIFNIGTNLNCSEVAISHVSHTLRSFITLCFPELKLQFVLPSCNILLTIMNALEKEQRLASIFYGSVFLMTVRLADDYFLSLSTLHTTKTMTVLQKATLG